VALVCFLCFWFFWCFLTASMSRRASTLVQAAAQEASEEGDACGAGTSSGASQTAAAGSPSRRSLTRDAAMVHEIAATTKLDHPNTVRPHEARHA
jgi:hypothetical protein